MKAITTGFVVGALALAALTGGCGGSDSERVAKLERRVAKLEAENASLDEQLDRRDQALLSMDLDLRLELAKQKTLQRANDQALYRGVAAAQSQLSCGPDPPPGCRVPLGAPGTVYTVQGEPGRIFASPFP